jgi:pyruvyltransferase
VEKISSILSELFYFIREKFPDICKAKILGNGIYARWGKFLNFGDQLTPIILRHYGFTPIYSQYKPSYGSKAEFVCVGTLLQDTPNDFSGIVLGSGMDDVVKDFSKATILGVRGKLTQKNLNLKDDSIVLGDPGLLVSFIFPKKVEKKWDLGIIPHFMDKNESIVEIWKSRFGTNVKFIDVQQTPEKVISDIKQCRHIVSSSLHGLITSDAFNIPNIMFTIRGNEKRPKNDDYKFKDYYSSLGINLKLIEATGEESFDYLLSKTTSKGSLVQQMQENLNAEFKKLPTTYKNYIRKDTI